MLDAFKVNKAFVLLDSNDKNVILSARNIQDVKTAGVNELNVYDVLKYQTVVATKAAVEKIQEVYA
jgi:large subunit ribosomal protein L4